MIPKRIVALAVAGLLLLPIAIVLVLATAQLLAAMQDAAGAAVLQRIGLALGLIWLLGLIGLVLTLGINTLDADDERPGDNSEEVE
ncbi:MAG TPA: hypothetical protein VJ783_15575 [Pirellulales bacterium]|nr:hypothetical protein [Pirellulales bacterium]